MNPQNVLYYQTSDSKSPVEDFIDSLEKNQKAKIFRIFLAIEIYGLDAVIQHTKKLTNYPLWEIRILGKDNIRILYLIESENSVLILHGFIKKSQKAPLRELEIALNRYNEWKQRNK